ncbi:hypothetical protein DY023_11165 [Microbacterium bovistercoris]|uniref:Uncharacterized protein n=1 Tax=Microbacterium bovistercoris TaxID=2293570 RepID=A0A371NSI5_9MICO|nr:hypothetical protein DY023_11165 [Microbacterium bovistercoris]
MLEERLDLILWSKILLGADPHRTNPVLAIRTELCRPCPDAPVTRDDDESEPSDDRHPFEVQAAEWHLSELRMPGKQNVLAP